jgi:hypothetical protein
MSEIRGWRRAAADDATVEQAVRQVVPQIAAVDASWEACYSELGCA